MVRKYARFRLYPFYIARKDVAFKLFREVSVAPSYRFRSSSGGGWCLRNAPFFPLNIRNGPEPKRGSEEKGKALSREATRAALHWLHTIGEDAPV